MFIKLRRSDTFDNILVNTEDISSIEPDRFGSTTLIMRTGLRYAINESMAIIERLLNKCASNK